MSPPASAHRGEIQRVLEKITEGWLKVRPEHMPHALGECFEDNMIIKGPGFELLAQGKEACIRSYQDFMRQASVRKFRRCDVHIESWEQTAVATYLWEMTYSMNGQDFTESGYDMFVFTRVDGRWRAVWRAILPSVTQS